jgi:hypothetical protein
MFLSEIFGNRREKIKGSRKNLGVICTLKYYWVNKMDNQREGICDIGWDSSRMHTQCLMGHMKISISWKIQA